MKKITFLLLTVFALIACDSAEKENTRNSMKDKSAHSRLDKQQIEKARTFLKAEAKAAHQQLAGKQVDMATVSDGCKFKNDNICYYYIVDEDQVSIASMEANRDAIENNLRAMLENMPATKPLIDNLKILDGKVIYQYKGSDTGKTMEIELEF